MTGDFIGNKLTGVLVVDAAQGDWQTARSTGTSFVPVTIAFKPWAASASMQPFAGYFTGNKKANICARQPDLYGGTLDVAISLIEPLSV